MTRTLRSLGLGAAVGLTVVLCASCAGAAPASTDSRVLIETVPDHGLQPQAVSAADGTVHVVYLKGDPAKSDVYYVRRGPDGHWTPPVRVNSQRGDAVALGTVRGANLALGRDGWVHVAWTGSTSATPRPGKGAPFLYTRLAPGASAFEPERNVVTWATGLDGGGSIAADGDGHVYAVWHAGAGAHDESGRIVALARSDDDGKTFGREAPIGLEKAGVCSCCWLQALASPDGHLWVVYRTARGGTGRDVALLTSTDHGAHVAGRVLEAFEAPACPMTTASLALTSSDLLAAWEQGGEVHLQHLSLAGEPAGPIEAAEQGDTDKHPVVAWGGAAALVAWTVDTGWDKGGRFAWRFASPGQPRANAATAGGSVPTWSLVAAAALPDGRFLLLH